MHARTIAATTVALLALTLTACNGSDSDSGDQADTKPSTSSQQADAKAALEQSVRSYTNALFDGDADGYALVSARCQNSMSRTEFAALAKEAHHGYGSLHIKTLHVDNLSGDLARVSYGVGVPQFERKAQPWAREHGTWKWDACPSSEPSK